MSVKEISTENRLNRLELKLMFREPVENNALAAQFPQRFGVLNMVGDKEGQLIRQTQEEFDTSGIRGHWKVFYSFYSVNIWLNSGMWRYGNPRKLSHLQLQISFWRE